jgi:hypothetical protein
VSDTTGSTAVTWHDREIDAYNAGRHDATAEIRAQARLYLTARYGSDVLETSVAASFQNWLERWLWAVASDEPGAAAEAMDVIVTGIKAKLAQDAEEANRRAGRPPLQKARRYDG